MKIVQRLLRAVHAPSAPGSRRRFPRRHGRRARRRSAAAHACASVRRAACAARFRVTQPRYAWRFSRWASIRVTCGVMSARKPSSRPDNWSTSLKVLQIEIVAGAGEQRIEVLEHAAGSPARSRGRGTGRGCAGAAARPARASAGRMSSMYSGRSQRSHGKSMPGSRRIGSPAAMPIRQEKQQQAGQHQDQPDEADLAVGHLRTSAKGVRARRRAPGTAARLRSSAPARTPSTGAPPSCVANAAHRSPRTGPAVSRRRLLSAAAAGRILQVLEEVRTRVEHQDVALVAEALAIRLEAAVEGVELGVLLERAGVDRRRLGIALALDALRVAIGLVR